MKDKIDNLTVKKLIKCEALIYIAVDYLVYEH